MGTYVYNKYIEGEASTHFWNVGGNPPDYTASWHWKSQYEFSLLWEPEMSCKAHTSTGFIIL